MFNREHEEISEPFRFLACGTGLHSTSERRIAKAVLARDVYEKIRDLNAELSVKGAA
jgi:hypothetical protein